MPDVSRQRCYNHGGREAVAICPDCNRFFCRECITEHDDRVLCSVCLKNKMSAFENKKNRFEIVKSSFMFLGSVLFLWFTFYTLGKFLLKIPSSFHEGTLWKNLW